MKIRIAGNSIRLRLKKPEVMTFGREGSITERIEFGSASEDQIGFILTKSDSETIEAVFSKNIITIGIPSVLADRWVNTGLVGIEDKVMLKDERMVSVLIEKDFACLDGTQEENEGTFDNPLLNCQTPESAH